MRPIDADELEKSLENYSNNHGLINAFVEFLNVMDEVHTLDVKPVVHGEWVSAKAGKLFPSNDFKCSKCGNLLDFDGVNCGRGDANFCPNCGADMREEEQTNE